MSSDLPNTVTYFIGVDVGTASVRAGIFRGSNGDLMSSAAHSITIFHHDDSNTRYYEQSSTEIWVYQLYFDTKPNRRVAVFVYNKSSKNPM